MTTTTTADSGTDTTTGTDDDTSTGAGTSTTTDTTTTGAGTDKGTEPDLAADVARWKALARKHEAESKANKKAREELDAINAAAMSDQEKAVKTAAEKAREEARAEVMKEVGGKLAEAAIKVAATSHNPPIPAKQLAALMEGVDASRFLDDNGDADTAAIEKWIDRVAPEAEAAQPGRRDLGQGARGGQAPGSASDPLEEHLKSILGV